MTQTVTAYFDHPSAAQVVVEELLQAGFGRGDIGTLAEDVRSGALKCRGLERRCPTKLEP